MRNSRQLEDGVVFENHKGTLFMCIGALLTCVCDLPIKMSCYQLLACYLMERMDAGIVLKGKHII